MEDGQEKKKITKKNLAVIGSLVAVAVLACLVGMTIYATPANRVARQLDLGQKYLDEQDYEQAIIAFTKAIEIDAKDVGAYFGLSQAYESMGDMEQAAAALEQGWEVTDSPQIRERLVELNLIRANGKAAEQDYVGSLAVFDRLLELDRENGAVIDALGECLNAYLAVLMSEQNYAEVRALAEKYADVAVSVDFDALLKQIQAIEEQAESEEPKTAQQTGETEAVEETSSAEETETVEETGSAEETKPVAVLEETAGETITEQVLAPAQELEIVQETSPINPTGEVIIWKEKAIEQTVRYFLDKPEGDIYTSEVANIEDIMIHGKASEILPVGDNVFVHLGDWEGRTSIRSLEDLKYFTALEGFTLYCGEDISEISDISVLSGLTKLKYLDLRVDGSINDLGVVNGLTNLESLGLSCDNITDLNMISGLISLRGLSLVGSNISDISVLSNLTNLERLDLSWNNLSDISALSGLTNLERLDLSWNNLSDISALSNLTNLEFLDLFGNNITDYTPASFVPYVFK